MFDTRSHRVAIFPFISMAFHALLLSHQIGSSLFFTPPHGASQGETGTFAAFNMAEPLIKRDDAAVDRHGKCYHVARTLERSRSTARASAGGFQQNERQQGVRFACSFFLIPAPILSA